MERRRALVIDGDPNVRATIQTALESHDVESHGAAGPAEARQILERLKASPLQALFVDLDTEDGADGLLPLARGLRPAPVLIGIASNPRASGASDFIRSGGFELLARPIDPTALSMLLQRLDRQLGLAAELQSLRRALRSREGYDRLVGRSSAMERVREQLEVLAQNELPLWLSGEAGTGKALAARTIHHASTRAEQPFVVVGCAELARGVSQGHWLLADGPLAGSPPDQARGGSLFLEDVTQLPPELQASLLTLLEADPVAGAERGDTPRLLAASSRDPRREIDQGRLLDRLHRTLSAATLNLPPLRERTDDIHVPAGHFISSIVEINHLPPMQLSAEALALLEHHSWPGNVQELRNAIEHAVILVGDGVLRPRDLPDWIHHSPTGAAVNRGLGGRRRFRDAKREVVESFEQAYLSELLRQHGGNVTTASQEAGMLRSALQRLLRKHGLKSASFRQDRSAAVARERRPDRTLAE